MVKIIGKTYPHVYSRIRIKCNPYYDVHGSSYRTCNPGGVWSGSNPSCRGMDNKNCSDRAIYTSNLSQLLFISLLCRKNRNCYHEIIIEKSQILRSIRRLVHGKRIPIGFVPCPIVSDFNVTWQEIFS